MSKLEEQIKTIIDALLDASSKEVASKNAESITKLKAIYDSDAKRFFDVISFAYSDFEEMISMVVDVPEQKYARILKFITNGLYEHFFRKFIEQKEGSACSGDKVYFIRDMTLKALKENRNISLYQDYSNIDRITEDKERQAYWSPKTIKDTNHAMELFGDWYLLEGDLYG